MLFVFATPVFSRFAQLAEAATRAAVGIGVLMCLSIWMAPEIAAEETADLRASALGNVWRQARVVVEIDGRLKLNPDGQNLQHVPLAAKADLHYVERDLSAAADAASWRAVRSYRNAAATIKLRDTELRHALREQRRLIAVHSTEKEAVLFSPLGPLTREELELVEAPASSIALETLLPNRRVKIAETWTLDDALVARMLGLEAVSQQNVVGSLQSIEDGLAIVTLEGTVAGAIGGVSSDIELKGKLNYDLKQQLVTWLTLAYKENRAIGHAQPGFEVLTKVRIVAAPASPIAELGDTSLADLPLAPGSGQTLIDLAIDSAGFQLAHDRRWRVMLERHDATVLRLVDRGDLIAQCNISPLPELAEGHQLTSEGFQQDVKQALGKTFGQIVESSEEVGSDGIRVLRVVAEGTVGELPIRWLYYHLSDEKGHRAALVFTIESRLAERYPQIDRELVAGFRFLPDRAPKAARAEKESAKR